MKNDFTICHVIGMATMEQMGDITRHIYEKCVGNHIWSSIHDKPPFADIYLIHNFARNSFKYINFKRPHADAKIISLIHSSMCCRPAKCSDVVICLTEVWNKKAKEWGYNSIVIPGCIYTDKFIHKIDYKNQKFDRITRFDKYKVNVKWNSVAKSILNCYPHSECHFFVSNLTEAPLLEHHRMFYDTSIKINEHAKKIEKLSKLSMNIVANGSFADIFPIAIMEGMAAGLCTIILDQPSISEMVGYGGIICKDMNELENKCHELICDTEKKAYWGNLAKRRANEFSVDNMVNEYNKLFYSLI